MRPPEIGHPLPRWRDAWYEERKWSDWIFSPRGHGPDWQATLKAGPNDRDALWTIFRVAIAVVPVSTMHVAGDGGLTCGVPFGIALRGRRAHATTVWHVARRGDPPRLASAYPQPYTRFDDGES
jgi:hypothetical protein